MIKFKPASKLRILAIISCALIVIGMTLGTVLHFVNGNFFNYGGEYSSYKSVSVSYIIIETESGELDLEAVCNEAFDNAGVSYYLKTEDSSALKSSGQIEYRFTTSTDAAALNKAVKEINDKIKQATSGFGVDAPQSRALMHSEEAIVGGEHVTIFAAIVLATIIVAQLIYTMIRYRFSAAFAAIVVDLHNLALFAALLAICRVPVSSTVMVFAVLLTLVTVVGVTYMLERYKRNAKDSANEKLNVAELINMSASQTAKINVALPAFLALVAVLLFGAMAISALSVLSVLVPSLLALVAFAVAIYGDVMFAPAIYCLFKKTGNSIKVSLAAKKAASDKPSQKKGK